MLLRIKFKHLPKFDITCKLRQHRASFSCSGLHSNISVGYTLSTTTCVGSIAMKRPAESDELQNPKRVKDVPSSPEEKSPTGDQEERRNSSADEQPAENLQHTAESSRRKGAGKKGSRRRERRRNDEGTSNRQQDGEKALRLPKRQCALLIGFCGAGYSGMQIQPDHTRTIEGVLFTALVKAGAVSQDNADDPVKVNLARAARTDAGVHAAGNVVSLKMIMNVPGVTDLKKRINEELPSEIRLWDFVRVQNSFNARLVCDSRKYTYSFPSYLLLPPKPGSGIQRSISNLNATFTQSSTTAISDDFWNHHDSPTFEGDLLHKRSWRIGQQQLEDIRSLARKYEGTHNFHNFTVDRDYSDRSNNRFMKKIEIADPVVFGETEWIRVLFHGQSFMLHQRKMMFALVMACRMGTPARVIDELYGPRHVFIPKMPALGLLLEEPLFHSYNERMMVINEKYQPTDADYRPPISFEAYKDDISLFKEQYIYENMRRIEDRDGFFDAWIRGVDAYAGNDLLYLNSAGEIPEQSVIKKDERRENPFREKRIFDATSFTANKDITRIIQDEYDDENVMISKANLGETEG